MSMIETVSRPGALMTRAPVSLQPCFSSLPTIINERLPGAAGAAGAGGAAGERGECEHAREGEAMGHVVSS